MSSEGSGEPEHPPSLTGPLVGIEGDADLQICPRGCKTFFMLNSAEQEIIMFINIKMPTIVGILTFISMINTTSKNLKAFKVFKKTHHFCF